MGNPVRKISRKLEVEKSSVLSINSTVPVTWKIIVAFESFLQTTIKPDDAVIINERKEDPLALISIAPDHFITEKNTSIAF